jgi:hypothetical protein
VVMPPRAGARVGEQTRQSLPTVGSRNFAPRPSVPARGQKIKSSVVFLARASDAAVGLRKGSCRTSATPRRHICRPSACPSLRVGRSIESRARSGVGAANAAFPTTSAIAIRSRTHGRRAATAPASIVDRRHHCGGRPSSSTQGLGAVFIVTLVGWLGRRSSGSPLRGHSPGRALRASRRSHGLTTQFRPDDH